MPLTVRIPHCTKAKEYQQLVCATDRCPLLTEITFRRLAQSDLPMLTDWLAEPHVRRFYQKTAVSLEDVAIEYAPVIRGEEPSSSHLAFCDGEPFAYLQCYRNADYPDWARLIDVADGISIDLFIGNPGYLRRGMGRTALRAYVQQVAFPLYAREQRAYIGHDLTNTAALRCSEAAGFRPLRPFVEDGVEMLLLVINKSDLEI
jgi:aminoglycoside 6'-N-acetyltransferase